MPITTAPNTFQWPTKRGPLSPGIKDPQCWQDEGILVPHEMFRWYFTQVREMLAAMDNSAETWKPKLFGKWATVYFLPMVHHHHEAEETIYNPWITAAGATLTKSIETDHKSLMDGVDKATAIAQKCAAGNDSKAIAELKQVLTKWMEDCEAHFDEEEKIYPEALKSTGLSPEDEGKTVEKIIQGLGLDGNKKMLPAILYAMCLWGGEQKMQGFFDTLPPPIQLLCQKCWLDDFWVNNLQVMQAITSGVGEYVPESPQCALCTVM